MDKPASVNSIEKARWKGWKRYVLSVFRRSKQRL